MTSLFFREGGGVERAFAYLDGKRSVATPGWSGQPPVSLV